MAVHPRVLPTGQQVELQAADQRATVVEVSGGIRAYSAGGRDLLDGYDADEMCTGGRGQLLVPFPNRLRGGRYAFDGKEYQLPLTEPPKGNAIHGFLRWESWRLVDRGADHATLEHTLHPRAGYPFALHVSVGYHLDATGLTVTMTATNVGDAPLPYGSGAHPYLRVDGDLSGWWVESPAATHLVTDDRGIPTGAQPVTGTALDMREPRQLGDLVLDTAFTDLARDDDGRAWVRVWDAQRRQGVGLWLDRAHSHYMLFTGDSLPEVDRRRRAIAVEPMTCAPNAFASGDGLVRLEPGAQHVAVWGIAPL